MRILILKKIIFMFAISQSVFSIAMEEQTSHGKSQIFNMGNYESPNSRLNNDENLTVVVAISGGGYRAANFGIGALLALSDIQFNGHTLLDEVDYYSTVSGGGLASAAHIMSLVNTPNENITFRNYIDQDGKFILDNLKKNHGWRLLASMFNPKNMTSKIDRGDSLQRRLDKSLFQIKDKNRSLNLGDVFIKKGSTNKPSYPYWITNATMFSDGRIFSFTPDVLKSHGITCFIHRKKPKAVTDYYNIPYSLGARTSMNFPGGIPATTLEIGKGDHDCNYGKKQQRDEFEYLRLTDGGESDNLGIYSALQALNYERGMNPSQKQLLIVIDVFNGIIESSEDKKSSPIFIEAILRAMSLPLTAHRFRINNDLKTENDVSHSLLNSINGFGKIGVAVTDIDFASSKIRKTNTTLWMGRGRQCQLIIAGYELTMKSLGRTDVMNPSNVLKACETKLSNKTKFIQEEQTNINPNSGVLVFNRNEKIKQRERLISSLINQLDNAEKNSLDHYYKLRTKLHSTIEEGAQNYNIGLVNNEIQRLKDDVKIPSLSESDINTLKLNLSNAPKAIVEIHNKLKSLTNKIALDKQNDFEELEIHQKYNYQGEDIVQSLKSYSQELNQIQAGLEHLIEINPNLYDLITKSVDFESDIVRLELRKLLLISELQDLNFNPDDSKRSYKFSRELEGINLLGLNNEITTLKETLNTLQRKELKKQKNINVNANKIKGFLTVEQIIQMKKESEELKILNEITNSKNKFKQLKEGLKQLIHKSANTPKVFRTECESLKQSYLTIIDLLEKFNNSQKQSISFKNKLDSNFLTSLINAMASILNTQNLDINNKVDYNELRETFAYTIDNWPDLLQRNTQDIDTFLKSRLTHENGICKKYKITSKDTKNNKLVFNNNEIYY